MSDKDCCGECENCKDDSIQEQIRLDKDVYDGLVAIYVRKKMLPESIQVFDDYRSDGSSIEDALAHAVVNDMANEAMEVLITDLNYADALIAKGEAIKARYTFNKNKNNKEDNTDDNSTADETSR